MRLLEAAQRDIRHACRMIARMPVLATVVVLSLGCGIGANVVIFSWIQAVVFQPIPGVARAASYHLVEPRTENGMNPGTSWLEYRDLRERLRTFEDLLAFRMTALYVGEPGQVERAYGLLVSDNYFSALGLRPALGRFFRSDEVARPGSEPVVVISHEYWHSRFAAAPTVVGQSVRVNSRELTIVGVAPRGFQGTVLRLKFDLWLPATMAPALLNGSRELDQRGSRGYTATGLLRSNIARVQAQSDVDGVMRQLSKEYPETNATLQADVLPFWQFSRGPQRFLVTALAFLQAIMLLLLVAVCGNTANLMLARASARQREIGMRLALGAGPARIVRLLFAENMILALLGAGLGVAIGVWGTRAMAAIPLTIALPVNFETHVDSAGLVFATVLGLACGGLFGSAPALHLARLDPQVAFRASATYSGRSRLRNGLMAAQVTLAWVVLLAAALFLKSFLETRDTDPGFRREGVLLAAYDLTGRNTDPRDFAKRLLERVRALPSIEQVAIASSVPLDIHGLPSRVFTVDGYARADAGFDQALANTVTPGYLALMGIPLVAGSDFARLDDEAAPPQVIVNQEFVRRYLARLEPLGRRLQARGRSYMIVGVARNSLYNAFGEPPTPIIYLSFRDGPSRTGEIHIRTRTGGETAAAAAIQRTVRDLDAELPVYNVRTLSTHIETNLLFRRIPARMFAVLGPMLLVLAAIGIYAVVAYTVSQRTTEIGVRLALGATPQAVVRQFVKESLSVIAVGAFAGWSIALSGVILLGADLDIPIFVGVPLLLMAVAAAACWLSARRAANGDPMLALRQQ
ncbi:MAG: ABC transporter permease [Vicinamibacterales bacterium]